MKSQKKTTITSTTKRLVNDIPVEQPELIEIDSMTEKGESISTGLGDSISKITGALGIKECDACIKRKEVLNRMLKYLELSRDVTEEEALFIERLNKRPGYIAQEDLLPLFALYNSLFNKNLTPCRCGGTVNQIMSIINKSFEYNKKS